MYEDRFFDKFHSAAFDLGHIQHFVDQFQKMPGRLLDFSKAVHHPLRFPDIFRSDPRHPHNRVHRRADIVGHIR